MIGNRDTALHGTCICGVWDGMGHSRMANSPCVSFPGSHPLLALGSMEHERARYSKRGENVLRILPRPVSSGILRYPPFVERYEYELATPSSF